VRWQLSGFADEIDPAPSHQLAVLAELGIRQIECRSAWGVNVIDLDDSQLTTLLGLLDAREMSVSSVGSPVGKAPLADSWENELARAERAFAAADRLGAPVIRCFSFYLPEGADPAEHQQEVIDRLGALADRAATEGVVLALENEKGVFGDTPERCLALLDGVSSPWLRAAFDPANFVQCGSRPFDHAYPLLRGHLHYVQVKDALADSGRVVTAGNGDGQWRQILTALAASNYNGVFSMEPHLLSGSATGGFSGPEGFTEATRSFLRLVSELELDVEIA
jgi:sugar phosphate isomerase/epimerase